jgi:hypothetical protein
MVVHHARRTTMNTTPVIVYTMAAPCGCKYGGRFYTSMDCTALAQIENPTGRQQIRHSMHAKKTAVAIKADS